MLIFERTDKFSALVDIVHQIDCKEANQDGKRQEQYGLS